MKKRHIFLILLMLFICQFIIVTKTYATEKYLVNIYGKIVDEEEKPIFGVEIYYNGEKKAITDINGLYSIWIEDDENKKIDIQFKKSGYEISENTISSISYKPSQKYKYKNMKKMQSVFFGDSTSKNSYECLNKKLNQTYKQVGIEYESINNSEETLQKALEKMKYNELGTEGICFFHATNGTVNNLNFLLNQGPYGGGIAYYKMYVTTKDNEIKKKIDSKMKSVKVLDRTFGAMVMNELATTKILKYIYDEKEIIDTETAKVKETDMTISSNCDYETYTKMNNDSILGDKNGNVEINGKVNFENNSKQLEGLEYEVNLYEKSGNGFIKKKLGIYTEKTFYCRPSLEAGKQYYIEILLTKNAWENGYSMQEYNVKNGQDVTTNKKCVRNAKNCNAYKVPTLIEYKVEQELNEFKNTRLQAKTELFTIKEYQEQQYQDGIPKGNITKYTEIETNLNLEKREELDIELSSRVTNMKIVLSNGNVYCENKIDAKNTDFWSMDGQKYIFMNDKILYGSKIYIEYEIKIKNNGETTDNNFTVWDYLNNYQGMSIKYNPDERLLSNTNRSNSQEGWSEDNDSLTGKINYKDDIISNVKLKNNNFTIKGKGEVSKRLVVSQLMTTNTDTTYQNDVGIIGYKNSQKQRNGKNLKYKMAGTKGLFSSSETIYVLIPFGR